jgi:predicted RNase H-like nuclease (RuvC/YqgF family)
MTVEEKEKAFNVHFSYSKRILVLQEENKNLREEIKRLKAENKALKDKINGN